jgi:hypothetical protein
MHLDDYLRQVIAAIANPIRENCHETEFSCGDCERQRRCNLESSGKCSILAIQISRDGGRSWKREKARSELRAKSYRFHQA